MILNLEEIWEVFYYHIPTGAYDHRGYFQDQKSADIYAHALFNSLFKIGPFPWDMQLSWIRHAILDCDFEEFLASACFLEDKVREIQEILESRGFDKISESLNYICLMHPVENKMDFLQVLNLIKEVTGLNFKQFEDLMNFYAESEFYVGEGVQVSSPINIGKSYAMEYSLHFSYIDGFIY